MTSSAVLQLHQRDTFERNVTRALAFGAGAGLLHLALSRIGLSWLPLAYLAIAGASLAMVRGDRMDRLLLVGLSVALPGVAFLMDVAAPWKLALAGALTGVVMVRSHQCDRGGENQIGGARPGMANHVLGAALTGGLALAGTQVASVFAARLNEIATPALLTSIAVSSVLALFVAVGSISGHLALRPDPVEARCEELIPKLQGDFQTLAVRALNLYRMCGDSLAQLPREAAREELARTLGKMTKDAVELAADWAGVESQLEDHAQQDLIAEVEDLTKSAQAATDLLARRQLESAAASLKEELQRLSDLKRRRERILAKLKAQVALLERARVSLISLRSGHTQLKAAELTALARRFSTMATLQADEAKVADAAAVNAELAAHEAQAAVDSSSRMDPVEVIAAAPVNANNSGGKTVNVVASEPVNAPVKLVASDSVNADAKSAAAKPVPVDSASAEAKNGGVDPIPVADVVARDGQSDAQAPVKVRA
ncbi:MAG: hypothetical protein ACJ790_21585 [Myxococcaceae bacterium]